MSVLDRTAIETLLTALDTHVETSGVIGTGINTNGVRAITGDMVNKALNASMGAIKLLTDLKDSYFNLTDDNSDDITEGTVNLFMSVAQNDKLNTIGNSAATGALADAYLLSRANHAGTQLAATISDFASAVNAAISGFTGTGAYTNFTIVNGIVTAAS